MGSYPAPRSCLPPPKWRLCLFELPPGAGCAASKVDVRSAVQVQQAGVTVLTASLIFFSLSTFDARTASADQGM